MHKFLVVLALLISSSALADDFRGNLADDIANAKNQLKEVNSVIVCANEPTRKKSKDYLNILFSDISKTYPGIYISGLTSPKESSFENAKYLCAAITKN